MLPSSRPCSHRNNMMRRVAFDVRNHQRRPLSHVVNASPLLLNGGFDRDVLHLSHSGTSRGLINSERGSRSRHFVMARFRSLNRPAVPLCGQSWRVIKPDSRRHFHFTRSCECEASDMAQHGSFRRYVIPKHASRSMLNVLQKIKHSREVYKLALMLGPRILSVLHRVIHADDHPELNPKHRPATTQSSDPHLAPNPYSNLSIANSSKSASPSTHGSSKKVPYTKTAKVTHAY